MPMLATYTCDNDGVQMQSPTLMVTLTAPNMSQTSTLMLCANCAALFVKTLPGLPQPTLLQPSLLSTANSK